METRKIRLVVQLEEFNNILNIKIEVGYFMNKNVNHNDPN